MQWAIICLNESGSWWISPLFKQNVNFKHTTQAQNLNIRAKLCRNEFSVHTWRFIVHLNKIKNLGLTSQKNMVSTLQR